MFFWTFCNLFYFCGLMIRLYISVLKPICLQNVKTQNFYLFFQVHGKRFVYKFVCDLKQLIGYSASELNRLVLEADLKGSRRRRLWFSLSALHTYLLLKYMAETPGYENYIWCSFISVLACWGPLRAWNRAWAGWPAPSSSARSPGSSIFFNFNLYMK